jgi:hypothetical protein
MSSKRKIQGESKKRKRTTGFNRDKEWVNNQEDTNDAGTAELVVELGEFFTF